MVERDHPVYCAQCGSIAQAGDRFCGVCGAAIPTDAQDAAPTREIPTQVYPPPNIAPRGGNRKLLLWTALGALMIFLLSGAGTLALIGLGPTADLLRGTEDGPPAAEPPKPAGGSEEKNSTPSSASQGAEAHPAFDPLLPTLKEMTSVPIILPAALPPGFQSVAIDEATEGERYAILFLDDQAESREIVQPFVDAWVDGTLEATPAKEGDPVLPEYGPDFEMLSSGEIPFTNGALGVYGCYEPPPGTSGRFCVGAYTRQGYQYTLTLERPTPPEEEIQQVLSSMVPASGETKSGFTMPYSEEAEGSEAEVERATRDYYKAVDREEWAYTYDNLDSQTQAMFTEEEWYLKNQWFADHEGLELASMEVDVLIDLGGVGAEVTVHRTFTDGTSITRDTYFVLEDGEWKHRFTEEEKDIFMPGASYEEFVAAQQE